ncbi:MAG: histidinol dehydrogenase [Hydrotalea sp.]|nr:histidinol dehydrogenase [Hydrotalea sp.]
MSSNPATPRPTTIDHATPDVDVMAAFQSLLARRQADADNVTRAVTDIIAQIKNGGDAALLAYGKKFDHIPASVNSIDELLIVPRQKHLDVLSEESQAALRLAMERIEQFHRAVFNHYQLDKDFMSQDELGVKLGLRWTAIEKLGIYVPGGLSAYPSSVLMNAIPARVAGVKNITMVCPLGLDKNIAISPGKKFSVEEHANPLVLAAAYLAGVSSVLCLGGAGAVAAMAHGTPSIMPVDKIVGPGNEFVAEAKRQVFGKVGIDMIAGPSEVLVLADKSLSNAKDMTTKAAWIALDLISQAEHDPQAMAVLITDHAPLAEEVVAQVATILTTPSNDPDILAKQKIARASWQNCGAVVVVDDIATTGVALADCMAAEHVEVMVDNPEALAKKIRNAGAVFLGDFSPEAFGDYLAGPSHVLPTFQSARFSSGLSLFDFLKRTSMITGNPRAIEKLSGDIIHLANAEKLPHHGQSIANRVKK